MQPIVKRLNFTDHSRDRANMTYVYPVISRRSGGVSIGINLNPNNACNWRCIYCQVPNLKRGSAPKINLALLEAELRSFLHELIQGNFMQQQVPPGARRINDIALSGNGEPTSAKEFEQVIALLAQIKCDVIGLPSDLKLVLISNGSLIKRDYVQAGLARMATLNGEVWFKLDSVTREGRQQINNTHMSLRQLRENLHLSASLCSTWLQTCVFQLNGSPPTNKETNTYLRFLERLLYDKVPLQGVLLYGIARQSMQPESAALSNVTKPWIISFAAKIEALGTTVKISP